MTNWTDQEYLKSSQYNTAANLNTRIQLHERFSNNPYPWFQWAFDQLALPQQCSILELGCGSGDFWRQNRARISAGWQVLLSDFSEGMLAQAQHNLQELFPAFSYKVIDAQSIPFADHSFDFVFANHMLYHVPDRSQALAEIRRVLKPDGKLFASTIGERHMQEIFELAARFEPGLPQECWSPVVEFTLENGADQLAKHFAEVRMERYPDGLRVTEVEPLADYILSTARLNIQQEQRPELLAFLQKQLEQQDGVLPVTKDTGIFIAS